MTLQKVRLDPHHKTNRRKIECDTFSSRFSPPISAPLLVLNRVLHKDVVKMFKVIRRIMATETATGPLECAPNLILGSSTSITCDGECDVLVVYISAEHGE